MPRSIDTDTKIIVDALEKRGIEYEFVADNQCILRITFEGCEPILVLRTKSNFTGSVGIHIANNKEIASVMVEAEGVPVPQAIEYTDLAEAKKMLQQFGTLVVKPSDDAHGNAVKTDISSVSELSEAIDEALKISTKVIIQQQVKGKDIRVLFIGDTYAGALIRHPAVVTGDGQHTALELIEQENENPQRGVKYQKPLNKISLEAAESYLGDDINKLPASDEVFRVIGPANVGQGGYAEDITAKLHPSVVKLAKLAKDRTEVAFAGVDFMIEDETKPPSEDNKLNFLEINAQPWLGFHKYPQVGESQPVGELYLDWLQSQAKAVSSG